MIYPTGGVPNVWLLNSQIYQFSGRASPTCRGLTCTLSLCEPRPSGYYKIIFHVGDLLNKFGARLYLLCNPGKINNSRNFRFVYSSPLLKYLLPQLRFYDDCHSWYLKYLHNLIRGDIKTRRWKQYSKKFLAVKHLNSIRVKTL